MEQASSSRMRGAEMLDDDDDIEIIEQQHGSGCVLTLAPVKLTPLSNMVAL